MSELSEPDRLFPMLAPLETGWLDVGDGHRIHHARSGNPEGIPVLLLHGGPASGSSPHHARFFEPEAYHIIQFDQRGSGKSTPLGERNHNTTDDLICDIERLRLHLGVERWLVMGGSWGSALGLAYAARHPQACSGLLIRGVFLATDTDLHWYFCEMRHFLPRAWATFVAAVMTTPSTQGPTQGIATTASALIDACRERLENVDSEEARAATAAYMQWEQALGSALAPVTSDAAQDAVPSVTAEHVLKYRLQLHYMAHGCFVESGDILASASRLSTAAMPVAIVHGQRDCICRPGNAWQVFQAIEGSRLRLIDNTGHDPFSNEMVAATNAAVRSFATNGNFSEWESNV